MPNNYTYRFSGHEEEKPRHHSIINRIKPRSNAQRRGRSSGKNYSPYNSNLYPQSYWVTKNF